MKLSEITPISLISKRIVDFALITWNIAYLSAVYQGIRNAFLTCPGSSTNTVNVKIFICRRIEIYYCLHSVYIKPRDATSVATKIFSSFALNLLSICVRSLCLKSPCKSAASLPLDLSAPKSLSALVFVLQNTMTKSYLFPSINFQHCAKPLRIASLHNNIVLSLVYLRRPPTS